MLDTQINMYSVDTGHFYSNYERHLHNVNCKYRQERNYIQNKLPEYEELLKTYGYDSNDIKYIKSGSFDKVKNIIPNTWDILREYTKWNLLIKYKRQMANDSKKQLLDFLKRKTEANKISENAKKKSGRPVRGVNMHHIRVLNNSLLNDNSIISVFESSLTRSIGIKPDQHTDSLSVIQVYYFDVFKDIMNYGFTFNHQMYQYFTSSAGQIRKKKAVFIQSDIWKEIEPTILCGLTIDKINKKGGNNVNKHLAYMALANSATDLWNDFDIDKTIVIDDFETNVFGTFDFIDETDYSITRKTDYVPVPHSDGSGMVLPSLLSKNAMFRAPWIKGLLGVYDFVRQIIENGYSPIIKDIYGKEHNVIDEGIQIIFTKSQFKMYKYYDSWDEYKQQFKKYHCSAGLCNVEEDRVKNAKINYQMLQTLTNITDDEIDLLTQKSRDKITNICTSQATMLEILGATAQNSNPTPFQKALKIYPELLNDTYTKDIIRDVKNSLLKKYRSGKLEVFGKYTFLLPDFYAACEYWFGHIDNPKGLLADKEVFCWLFQKSEKLDCLRSPHLYKEHAIRFNVASHEYGDRAKNIRKWFTTNALYTSSFDLVSKILQFDVDGDKSLVVADRDFIRIAERNMNGIVPLYYNMRKAEPTQLNNENIYAGLNAAFTGGNIGLYSNDISKIWNDDVFISGTEEEKDEAITAVKLLCCENNFVIDYAKTLYKPTRPQEKNELITKFTHKKLPAFFEYAKDKDKSQVEERNDSLVNKIYSRIPNKPISTRDFGLSKIESSKMMSNANVTCSNEVMELYDSLNTQYRYMINMKDEYTDNLRYVACKIRAEFSRTGYSDEMITDMLVKYLYGKNKRYKQLLWFCYGQQIVNNLQRNIEIKKTKIIQCVNCGEWFEVDIDSRIKRCFTCREDARLQKYNSYNQKRKFTTS